MSDLRPWLHDPGGQIVYPGSLHGDEAPRGQTDDNDAARRDGHGLGADPPGSVVHSSGGRDLSPAPGAAGRYAFFQGGHRIDLTAKALKEAGNGPLEARRGAPRFWG